MMLESDARNAAWQNEEAARDPSCTLQPLDILPLFKSAYCRHCPFCIDHAHNHEWQACRIL